MANSAGDLAHTLKEVGILACPLCTRGSSAFRYFIPCRWFAVEAGFNPRVDPFNIAMSAIVSLVSVALMPMARHRSHIAGFGSERERTDPPGDVQFC
jgi:hypothetical protein